VTCSYFSSSLRDGDLIYLDSASIRDECVIKFVEQRAMDFGSCSAGSAGPLEF
jgi:hypothetical protein